MTEAAFANLETGAHDFADVSPDPVPPGPPVIVARDGAQRPTRPHAARAVGGHAALTSVNGQPRAARWKRSQPASSVGQTHSRSGPIFAAAPDLG